jgi:hypothetical protein
MPITLINRYSTLADLAGVVASTHLEGRSLVPLLREAQLHTLIRHFLPADTLTP